ncbi:hypothetical protein CIB95_11825 [Lottiidibacillus patelloidae]|uniref:Uncharacterized protein n=1 Tax=Lottiidibacillus patelloidae TaxID=2670334 RepID=A0A263BSW2_9BACI|nr:hypothetical protein [Lottiidibacillus patelloidae]OZM56457.1 hypothetical protein CIB95_11825 [Lottiidibacillus patelloidae]
MEDRIKLKLDELVRESWDTYKNALTSERLKGIIATESMPQSMPILYFGDLQKYLQSEVKIITVGVNPSRNEFPHKPEKNVQSFMRFPTAENLTFKDIQSKSEASETYLKSLNNYFRIRPLNWFYSYEPILNGMNSSYWDDYQCKVLRNCQVNRKGKPKNTVIQTDIFSILPTDPVFGQLTTREQSELKRAGRNLWKKLVQILKPDVILLDLKRRDMESVIETDFKSLFGEYEDREVLYKKEIMADGAVINEDRQREKVYYLSEKDKPLIIYHFKRSFLPYQNFSSKQKYEIGQCALELLSNEYKGGEKVE